MDDLGHAAWSYLIWHSTPYAALAAFMSVFPDLLGVIPPYAAAFLRNKGDFHATWHKKNMPAWYRRYNALMFDWTHSVIISLVVSLTVIGIFGWHASFMLAWPLHVFVDIFTHPKEKACEYLWPFHDHRFDGIAWWNRTFMLTNYAAICVVAFFVLR